MSDAENDKELDDELEEEDLEDEDDSDDEAEDEEDKSNVYSMSGEPYEAPDDLLNKPCEQTVDCLNDVLNHAIANQIRGVYVLGWSPQHQRFVRWGVMPAGEAEEAAAVRFLGGLELAKADMIATALSQVIEIDEDGNIIE